jgi:proline iminopeptidase
MSHLYPPLTPYRSGHMAVGHGHEVYWEECGNPMGRPVVFLHGGPGGGCSPNARRLFDPRRYRIILMDQRGCGRSTPHAETAHNFLADLVADVAQLRLLMNVQKWLLCGGSWGCTLALAYAKQYSQHVSGMVLRGVFAAQDHELDWLYKAGGASRVFRREWQDFVSAIQMHAPIDEKNSAHMAGQSSALLKAYDKVLQEGTKAQVLAMARAWCTWEDALSSVYPSDLVNASQAGHEEDLQCLAMAKISAHMFANDPDLGSRGNIVPESANDFLQNIPGIIVQGQFDMVTPAETAWQLKQVWPLAQLRVVHTAGHSSQDPELQSALVQALDEMLTEV